MKRERPTCRICEMGDHRYGTSDPNHKYDAMACVNMLRPQLDEAERVLRRIATLDYRGNQPPAIAMAFAYFNQKHAGGS